MNPLDAVHGDLGEAAPDDLALLLSNSGVTEEALQLIPISSGAATRASQWWGVVAPSPPC